MAFEALADIVALCEREQKPFWRVVCEEDAQESGMSCDDEIERMSSQWLTMLQAAKDYDRKAQSESGLTGGDGGRFSDYVAAGDTVCGSFCGDVIAQALQMAESNACMKRIVAAPTAGSCGVLPAVLIPFSRREHCDTARMTEALFVAAGIGQMIALRASISGAEGGCQAEIGAASAMAAGALVHLKNGSALQITAAAGFALQNLLGLVCDPIAGLVEIPCVKRNVVGAMNACSCADMALAGLRARIPADETIDAMRDVGDLMHSDLKETGRGGLAATKTGKTFSLNFH
ncbi:MAG: L-serine ammonia-lyase, iron-sulfur-dependent, subunit alpha [Treponema sp.]|nr:L-serine ammonia-lyase, iron-sulfur-dependent, subunit alpha [Treponema sp.]